MIFKKKIQIQILVRIGLGILIIFQITRYKDQYVFICKFFKQFPFFNGRERKILLTSGSSVIQRGRQAELGILF